MFDICYLVNISFIPYLHYYVQHKDNGMFLKSSYFFYYKDKETCQNIKKKQ